MRHHRPLHHPLEATLCAFGAISHHCPQRGNQKGLRGHLPQLPPLLSCPSPRGLPAQATATRPAHSGLAGGSCAPILRHLARITIAIRVTFLHRMLEDLAWNEQIPTLTHLLSRADVPRREETLPASAAAGTGSTHSAGTAAPRRFPQQSLAAPTPHRHADRRVRRIWPWIACFPLGPDQWAIHVPLGKLKTERWVPVDAAVCRIVERLRTLRSPTSTSDPFLLPRNRARETLIRGVRAAFRDAVAAVGIIGRLVPHQNRHTYATEMLRSGVGLPALMQLLGHASPEMTLALFEDHSARLAAGIPPGTLPSPPSRSVPAQPCPLSSSARADLPTLLLAMDAAQYILEMVCRTIPDSSHRRLLTRFGNRLTKMRTQLRNFTTPAN